MFVDPDNLPRKQLLEVGYHHVLHQLHHRGDLVEDGGVHRDLGVQASCGSPKLTVIITGQGELCSVSVVLEVCCWMSHQNHGQLTRRGHEVKVLVELVIRD